MTIPSKKLKSSFELPVFGIGTWQMGGRYIRNPLNDDARDIQAIKTAIELGVTHIDTAEIYATGWAEKLVAKAIKDFDRRKLFIVSKVAGNHASYNGVLRACEKSLKRLETQYLDLYLIHWYDRRFNLKNTMRALDELLEKGLIKNIGVSNFTKERLAEAQNYTKNKIVCDQVHYNLMIREPERKSLLEYCQQNDVLLVAYRPVQKGLLLKNVPEIMEEMCKKYQKTPAQIAINWLIAQDNVVTIAKSSQLEHLKENLSAIGWQMEKPDIEKLRQEFPNQKDVSDVVSLE